MTVFDGRDFLTGTLTRLADFFAGAPQARRGVPVAAADTDGDGDGRAEVLAAPAGRVLAFRATTGTAPVRTFAEFNDAFTGGVFVG